MKLNNNQVKALACKIRDTRNDKNDQLELDIKEEVFLKLPEIIKNFQKCLDSLNKDFRAALEFDRYRTEITAESLAKKFLEKEVEKKAEEKKIPYRHPHEIENDIYVATIGASDLEELYKKLGL